MLHTFTLRTKLWLLLALAAAGLAAATGMSVATLHARLMADRVEKMQAIARQAAGLAAALEAEAQAGRLSRAAALTEFRNAVHHIRFGGAGDYLVAQDTDGTVIAHGGNPALEGRKTASHDSQGHSTAELIAASLPGRDEGVIRYLALQPGRASAQDKLSAVIRFRPWGVAILAGTWTDDIDAVFAASWHRLAAIGLGITAGMFLLIMAVNREIVRSFNGLRASMAALAGGALETDIHGLGTPGEIGAMAQTVQIFKNSMIEAEMLRRQHEDQKRLAEDARRRDMLSLASRFESNIGTIVNDTSTAAEALRGTAQSMAATSEGTAQQSARAAAASAHATQNVENVAAAAEELSASIREISAQIANAASFTQQSVQLTDRSNAQVQGLAEKAEKIGGVVRIIAEIAGRTNLLALNATIEAARAGEAGRGFAVVAAEVKALAVQTAQATNEISAQIAAIQEETRAAAQSLQTVTSTIGQVSATASAIASAVEEQGAATQEISRNVQQAASGTRDAAGDIGRVSEAAEKTGEIAGTVLAASGTMLQNSQHLRHHVQDFLHAVRAA